MNREETHALFALGHDKWNEWADKMLAEKAEMEKAGTWQVVQGVFGGTEPTNPATQAWFDTARADFSTSDQKYVFANDADFSDFKFPGAAGFSGATFTGDAWFGGATFSATKQRAPTAKSAYFNGARFMRQAQFNTAHFYGPVSFADACFFGEPNFSSIKSDVGFNLSRCYFARVPDLLQAELHSEPELDNVRIGGFESQWLSWLSWVPQPFPQLNWRPWHVTTDTLEDIKKEPGGVATLVKLRGNYHRFRLPFASDPNASAKFRKLKGYAKDSEDSTRELEFHAQEVRKSRFVTDWPLPWQGGFLRFWFGCMYDFVSNFGRSLLRPLALWGALLVVSAGFYLLNSPDIAAQRGQPTSPPWTAGIKADADLAIATYLMETKCVVYPDSPAGVGRRALAPDVAKDTTLASEALHLSFLNASVIGGFSGDNSRRTYGCLYGLESDASGNTFPIVPNAVADLGAVQRLCSVVLIFLFGLAVKNMLGVK